jgi:hypothetical protein
MRRVVTCGVTRFYHTDSSEENTMIIKTPPLATSPRARALLNFMYNDYGTKPVTAESWSEHTGGPLEESQKIFKELVDAGILFVSDSQYSLGEARFATADGPHPQEYSHIDSGRRGRSYIEVTVWDEENAKEFLILSIMGGVAETHHSQKGFHGMEFPAWMVSARAENLVDEEHDSVFLARVIIDNPTFTEVSPRGTIFTGRIVENAYYPFGGVPQIADLDEDDVCEDGCSVREGTHGSIDNYNPKPTAGQRSMIGKMARVVVRNRLAIDENGAVIR